MRFGYTSYEVASELCPLARNCLARDYLQARILEAIQDAGALMRWAFVGGTALRFLFPLLRFSEDLDFSLIEEDQEPAFASSLKAVKQAMTHELLTGKSRLL